MKKSPVGRGALYTPDLPDKGQQSVAGFTALGPNTWLVESSFGDYSYTAGNVQIIYAEVGKYCSIANSVRINPGNHPQWRVTQHHMTYRRVHYGLGAEDDAEFAQWHWGS